MPGFRITPKAVEDLKNIGRYTLQQWGKAQRNAYLQSLEQRMQWLAVQPRLGKARPEVGIGYYSFPQGRHIIFYLIRDDGIDVLGVPHQEMDVNEHLSS